MEWYLKAANQGNISAMNNLGYMYEKGDGVDQNWQKAAEMFLKAAEKGDAQAQYNIANCYYNGWGIEKNFHEAAKWYQKAFDNGKNEAIQMINYMAGRGEL